MPLLEHLDPPLHRFMQRCALHAGKQSAPSHLFVIRELSGSRFTHANVHACAAAGCLACVRASRAHALLNVFLCARAFLCVCMVCACVVARTDWAWACQLPDGLRVCAALGPDLVRPKAYRLIPARLPANVGSTQQHRLTASRVQCENTDAHSCLPNAQQTVCKSPTRSHTCVALSVAGLQVRALDGRA